MSRLDSAIRRLEAQRDCLNLVVSLIQNIQGPVLELGLGNGRTYSHLRTALPERRIVVFERKAMAHPDSMPPAADLIEGDFRETIPGAIAITLQPAALIHADIGSGERAATADLAAWLGPMLAPLAAPGALIISDQPLVIPSGEPLPLPAGVAKGRYNILRIAA